MSSLFNTRRERILYLDLLLLLVLLLLVLLLLLLLLPLLLLNKFKGFYLLPVCVCVCVCATAVPLYCDSEKEEEEEEEERQLWDVDSMMKVDANNDRFLLQVSTSCDIIAPCLRGHGAAARDRLATPVRGGACHTACVCFIPFKLVSVTFLRLWFKTLTS